MIPEIKNILYATDLSESARHCFGYAASLSERYGATITILHVLEDLTPSTVIRVREIMGEKQWLELLERNKQQIIDKIHKRIEELCQDASNGKTACNFQVGDILIPEGPAVSTILETADKSGADIIVMGTHGYGTFKEALMGSTARRVVRRSPVPVLTVRLPQE